MAYSKELRERAIAWMLSPINASLPAVSRELNIPCQTLYSWHTQSSKEEVSASQAREVGEPFDAHSKLTVVL